jgi:hypothetical protein
MGYFMYLRSFLFLTALFYISETQATDLKELSSIDSPELSANLIKTQQKSAAYSAKQIKVFEDKIIALSDREIKVFEISGQQITKSSTLEFNGKFTDFSNFYNLSILYSQTGNKIVIFDNGNTDYYSEISIDASKNISIKDYPRDFYFRPGEHYFSITRADFATIGISLAGVYKLYSYHLTDDGLKAVDAISVPTGTGYSHVYSPEDKIALSFNDYLDIDTLKKVYTLTISKNDSNGVVQTKTFNINTGGFMQYDSTIYDEVSNKFYIGGSTSSSTYKVLSIDEVNLSISQLPDIEASELFVNENQASYSGIVGSEKKLFDYYNRSYISSTGNGLLVTRHPEPNKTVRVYDLYNNKILNRDEVWTLGSRGIETYTIQDGSLNLVNRQRGSEIDLTDTIFNGTKVSSEDSPLLFIQTLDSDIEIYDVNNEGVERVNSPLQPYSSQYLATVLYLGSNDYFVFNPENASYSILNYDDAKNLNLKSSGNISEYLIYRYDLQFTQIGDKFYVYNRSGIYLFQYKDSAVEFVSSAHDNSHPNVGLSSNSFLTSVDGNVILLQPWSKKYFEVSYNGDNIDITPKGAMPDIDIYKIKNGINKLFIQTRVGQDLHTLTRVNSDFTVTSIEPDFADISLYKKKFAIKNGSWNLVMNFAESTAEGTWIDRSEICCGANLMLKNVGRFIFSSQPNNSISTYRINARPKLVNALPIFKFNQGMAKSIDLNQYFSDIDQDPLTFSAQLPAGLTLSAAGTLTADGSLFDNKETSLTVSDGYSALELPISVLMNKRPVLSKALPVQAILVGSAISFDLKPYFIDPEGSELLFTADTKDGLSLSNSGVITGVMPNASLSFSFTVTDADGIEISQAVQFKANSAPVWSGKNAYVFSVSQNTFLDLSPLFNDAEGDAITLEVSGLPQGLTFSKNTIGGIPNTAGTYSVGIVATDVHGASTKVTIQVQNNAAPVWNGKNAYVFTVSQNVFFDLSPLFNDAEGDAINLQVTGLPEGLTFSNKAIGGLPSTAGTYNVAIVASDVHGASTTVTIQVQINAAAEKPQTKSEGGSFGIFNLLFLLLVYSLRQRDLIRARKR